ncbi:MAG: HisA/HisF-related TIM barrel protein [Candidatus Eisenbacteria bacterium]|nr:HisA/HisF-related TIM barrel protein [Candidatus Eisenbacteria bacterium]
MGDAKVIQIFPAIDLLDGKVVRMRRGEKKEVITYSSDPAAIARRWEKDGADCLHIVDLGGRFSEKGNNVKALRSIADAVKIPWQLSASIEDENAIETILDLGGVQVVLGPGSTARSVFVKKALARFGGSLSAAIDFREEGLLFEESPGRTQENLQGRILNLHNAGFRDFVLTDVTRDGTMKGPNVELLRNIDFPQDSSFSLAGGVSTLGHVAELQKLGSHSLRAIIVGRALYEGKLRISAVQSVLNNPC